MIPELYSYVHDKSGFNMFFTYVSLNMKSFISCALNRDGSSDSSTDAEISRELLKRKKINFAGK